MKGTQLVELNPNILSISHLSCTRNGDVRFIARLMVAQKYILGDLGFVAFAIHWFIFAMGGVVQVSSMAMSYGSKMRRAYHFYYHFTPAPPSIFYVLTETKKYKKCTDRVKSSIVTPS